MARTAHEDTLRSMDSHLDVIADSMRSPCTDEDQRQLVADMLRECQEQRGKLEEAAMVVIGQDGGESIFNEITGMLDRLEQLQERYRSWAESVGQPEVATSGNWSPHMSQTGSQSEQPVPETKKEKKRGREKKEKKQRHDEGEAELSFPPQSQDIAFPPLPDLSGGAVPTRSFGSWPDADHSAVRAPVHGSFEDAAWGTVVADFGGGHSVSWGDTPAAPPASHGKAGGFGADENLFPYKKGHKEVATLHIRLPFAEVEYDQEHFKMQFARAAAQAAGISPHRIRVLELRPSL